MRRQREGGRKRFGSEREHDGIPLLPIQSLPIQSSRLGPIFLPLCHVFFCVVSHVVSHVVSQEMSQVMSHRAAVLPVPEEALLIGYDAVCDEAAVVDEAALVPQRVRSV